MKNVMLGLDTLGTCTDAVILSIGAIAFDPSTNTLGDKFKAVIDIESSLANGGKVEGHIISLWLMQHHSVRKAVITEPEIITDVLNNFTDYLTKVSNNKLDDIKLWGNGATFTHAILSTAYRNAGLAQPWRFYNNRCYKTVASVYPSIKVNPCDSHCTVLDDVTSQAKHLMDIHKAVNSFMPINI